MNFFDSSCTFMIFTLLRFSLFFVKSFPTKILLILLHLTLSFRIKVSPTDSRIGIIQFSNEANTSPRLNLQDGTDQDQALLVASNLALGADSGTNLADGINEARLMLQQYDRSVPQTIVVVSTRQSDNSDDVITNAKAAALSFIQVMSVGVDEYSEEELQNIATDDTMFVTADSFYALTNLDILPNICPGKL